jgi:hypothetical protein
MRGRSGKRQSSSRIAAAVPSSARVLGETSLSVLAERETFDLNECRL